MQAEPSKTIFPGKQTLEAAVRIASIAEGMGCSLGDVQKWVAELGLKDYEWNLTPNGLGRLPQ